MAESDVPIVCTLSPNMMIDQLMEYERLFKRELTALEREPLRLRLVFGAAEGAREAELRELIAREQECCAFLTFTWERTDAGLVAQIVAPAAAERTLDGLQTLAERNMAPERAG